MSSPRLNSKQLTSEQARSAMTILAGLGFANVCASNIFFPMLPALQEALRLPAFQLGAWTSIPALISLIFGPLLGRLGDMRGRRSVVFLGLFFFIIGALLSFFIPALAAFSPYVLIMVGRILQNLGHAATFPQYLAVASESLPTKARQKAMGTIESWTSIGGIFGPIIGSLLLPFGLYLPFLATAVIALLALLVAWRTPFLPGRVAPHAPAGHSPRPSLRLLTSGWHAFLGGFLVMGLMVAVQTFAGTFARDQLAASRLVQGLMTSVVPAAMAVGSIRVSSHESEHRVRNRTVIVSVAITVAGTLLWFTSRQVLVALLGLLGMGLGLGTWLPVGDHDISETSTDATRGTRLAILHASKTFGIFVAPAVAGRLIDQFGNYSTAFGVLLLVFGALSIISVVGRRRDVPAPR